MNPFEDFINGELFDDNVMTEEDAAQIALFVLTNLDKAYALADSEIGNKAGQIVMYLLICNGVTEWEEAKDAILIPYMAFLFGVLMGFNAK